MANNSVTITENNLYTVKVSDTGLKGRPGVVFRGQWLGTSDYYVGDVVKYNGSTWINSQFIAASTTAFPTVTPASWTIFSEKGEKGDPAMSVSATAPIGTCSVTSYTTQASCQAAGNTWTLPQLGDMWFDLTVGRLYSRVEDAQGDAVWFDISGVVGSMDASDIVVAADGDLPAGTLQEILKRLEDELFKQTTAPTGAQVTEGDLWYDTSTDQMKFYRNGVWEMIVQGDALSDTTGYDSISMNGGYF
jgi:hypothetical protein